ncbi:uncharacterized protein LOC129759822 [Uranotaenia lowii]|uniref:uncharacterized protein LOC129759822 n=1 Tax=Uranotaenia lowii TaxID=190385 RepID=UPI002478CE43|nr:uncharacterized protein LOC129759822 [Uranotaenia lowii]
MCYGLDPFQIATEPADIPLNVSFQKIHKFLVLDPCPFTGIPKGDQGTSKKATDALLYFKNGWVKSIKGKKIGDIYIVHGSVHHSFAVKEGMLKPWLIIATEGTIKAAHCTCAVGLMECCSHIGATLYALDELKTKILEQKLSVTELPAYLKRPPVSITNDLYKKVKDIDFGRKIKRSYHVQSSDDVPKRVRNLLEDIDKVDDVLQDEAVEIHRSMANNVIHLQEIAELTEHQSSGPWWMQFRRGRITASNIKEVMRTSEHSPSISLIKKLCYPDKAVFSTPATRYGLQFEKKSYRHPFCGVYGFASEYEDMKQQH